jgi:hypothetical protein
MDVTLKERTNKTTQRKRKKEKPGTNVHEIFGQNQSKS